MNELGRAHFARLLEQRGIPSCDEEHLERWISVQETRPDFAARPLGFPPFLAEVAAPWRGELSAAGGSPPGGHGPVVKRLGRLVRDAAAQLRPYKRLGMAMVVVLDGGAPGEAPLEAGDLIPLAGALEDRRPYVSAVLLSLPKRASAHVGPADRERPMRVRVLHNPSAIVPLHLGIFAEPEDEHFVRMGDRWVDIRTGAPLLFGESPPAPPPPE